MRRSSYCYIGDARNNTPNSLLVTGALLGMDTRICGPRALWPAEDIVTIARNLAERSGARLNITDDLEEAVRGADFLYTDVWVSMGEPTETWAARIEELQPFQISSRVMALTGNPETKFMHCLPAMHDRHTELGEMLYDKFGLSALEVTDEVFESAASIVFDQAENRLHTIKAVMVATLSGRGEAARVVRSSSPWVATHSSSAARRPTPISRSITSGSPPRPWPRSYENMKSSSPTATVPKWASWRSRVGQTPHSHGPTHSTPWSQRPKV